MTFLCLYAITDRSKAVLPSVVGLNDACLQQLVYRDVAAVVSQLLDKDISPTEANLWCFEAVVEALMRDRTVLPVRFGTILSNEFAVLSVLEEYYDTFLADLRRVQNCVELALRVFWEEEDDDAAGYLSESGSPVVDQAAGLEAQSPRLPVDDGSVDGRGYLLQRLSQIRQEDQQWHRAQLLMEEIHKALVDLVDEDAYHFLPAPKTLLTSAHLVRSEQLPMFLQEVNRLQTKYPALRFACTGPWPPYNFVSRPT